MKSKFLKRALSFSLGAALTLGLAACGGGKDSNVSPDGKANISWFSSVTGWGPGNWNGTETCPLLDTLASDYGVTFTIEAPPADADTKLGLMIATDALPDMISLTNQTTVRELISSGKVWDMKEFLETYDPDSHILSDFPDDIKITLDNTYGGWYSLPSHMTSPDNRQRFPACSEVYTNISSYGSNGAIMFNKTMMDALGITQEDVQTEEGFYAACQRVKDSGYTVDGQSAIPVVLHGQNWTDTSLSWVIAANFGAVPVDENGDYRHMELSPGFKNALKFVQNCLSKGYLDVNCLTIDETALMTQIESGRVFCWIGNSANSDKLDKIPWVSFGPITAANGAAAAMGVYKQGSPGWIQTLISKKCSNPEALAKALSFATSREGQLLNQWGIEGEDYTIDAETGICTRTESGMKKWVDTYDNNMWLWPFNDNDFNSHTTAPAEAGTRDGYYNDIMVAMGMYDTTYIYDYALLDFQNSDVLEPSSDLGIALSQIKSYMESAKAKIVTAATDADFEKEYNDFISTLESYGIADIDKAYNEYYKEYCKIFNDTIVDVNADLYK